MDMSHMQFYTTIAPMMETPQMNYQPTFTILPVQTDQKVCLGTKRAHPAVSQGSGPGKKRTTIKGGFTKPQTESVSKRNERERNRVKQVNMGFETLRQHVPSGAKNKKMSKVDTLRAAVDYIHQLQGILQDTDAAIFETLGQDASWMQEPQIKCEQFSPSQSPVAAQHSPSHSADCMPSPGGYSSDGSANLSSTSQQPDLLDFSSWFQ